MSRGRLLVQALFTLALLGAVAILGQIPFGATTEHAALRLALRTVQSKIEVCRARADDELQALPQHMRTPEVCTEYTPRYDLRVELDGRLLFERQVSPGGVRGDRPMIIDHQTEVPPGEARLSIRFTPVAEESQPEEATALPHYELDRTVQFSPGRIALILLDDQEGKLVVYQD
jgi:hypothetical protein